MKEESVDAEEPAEIVAARMTDALAYLSRVAHDAGLESISSDLLSIRRKLKQAAKSVSATEKKSARRNIRA